MDSPDQDRRGLAWDGPAREIATTFGPFLSGKTGEGLSLLKYRCLPTADPTVWLAFLIAASFNGFLHPTSSRCHVGYSAHRASAHQPRSVDHHLHAAGGVHARCRCRTRRPTRVNRGRRQGRCVPRTRVFPREGLRCHILLATNLSGRQGTASTAARMGVLFPRA